MLLQYKHVEIHLFELFMQYDVWLRFVCLTSRRNSKCTGNNNNRTSLNSSELLVLLFRIEFRSGRTEFNRQKL